MNYQGTYIRFIEDTPKPKTRVWRLESEDGGVVLGIISWFGRWRKYAFSPYDGMVFEQTCLREIADFCENRTKEHKEKK